MKDFIKVSLAVTLGLILSGVVLFQMYVVYMDHVQLNQVINFLNKVTTTAPVAK